MNKYILFIVLLFLTGCTQKVNPGSVSNKPQVYTSFYAVYDLTSKIGGDKIDIYNMVPSGTEPHDWEPSSHDMLKLEKAEVLFYNGLGMENWIGKVQSSITNSNLQYVALSDNVTLLEGNDVDPHIWLSPLNAKQEAWVIKDTLISIDSQNADFYTANYDNLCSELDKLDQEYRMGLNNLPNKNIVVSHKAYSYLCNEYGLTQIAITGLSADSEPSPLKMQEIISFVKQNNIKYIFYEELLSPKISQTIANETNAKLLELNPYEGLTEAEIKSGSDYFVVMRENLTNLITALS